MSEADTCRKLVVPKLLAVGWDSQWEEFQTTQLNLRTLDVLEQIEKATQEYGPHLVWASQISEHDQERSWREMQETDARLLRLEIELGQLRRAKRSD